jgi:beta-glucosidase
MGWEVYPEGLYTILRRLTDDYKVPRVYVTENGCAYGDGPDEKLRVRDARRRDYLHAHVAQCLRAIADGVPLAGYFAWSLLDNFEWAEGYTKRFGLVYVDYATQQRVIKDSARWYAALIADNALPPGDFPP